MKEFEFEVKDEFLQDVFADKIASDIANNVTPVTTIDMVKQNLTDDMRGPSAPV